MKERFVIEMFPRLQNEYTCFLILDSVKFGHYNNYIPKYADISLAFINFIHVRTSMMKSLTSRTTLRLSRLCPRELSVLPGDWKDLRCFFYTVFFLYLYKIRSKFFVSHGSLSPRSVAG